MSGPKPDPRDVETRPISVAELLAKNGTIGSPPVTGRRRRRRGNADAVTVAELTGEIPIIRDEPRPEPEVAAPAPAGADSEPSGVLPIGPAPGFVEEERPATGPRPVQWAEPAARPAAEPRWPKSALPLGSRGNGPEQSPYPRPLRRSAIVENGQPADTGSGGSDAEQMRPDPVDTYSDIAAGVMEAVREADLAALEADATDSDAGNAEVAVDAEQYVGRPGVVGGLLVVLQSILAVAFGGGLFIVFDELWRWNSIVALVLTVLVTLGLVAAVQAVRKTVDIVSTLIAVAVGLLVTLGPLALHAN